MAEIDPVTGRYIQSDHIGFNGGVNTYVYANGNSLRFVDELGQNPADYILSLQPNDIYDDLEVRAVKNASSYQEIIDGREEIIAVKNYGTYLFSLGGGIKVISKGVFWSLSEAKILFKMLDRGSFSNIS